MSASIPVCLMSVPPWCDIAEVVMDAVWGCPSVCHTGDPLAMGGIWLGMVSQIPGEM